MQGFSPYFWRKPFAHIMVWHMAQEPVMSSHHDSKCVFCKIITGQIPAEKIYENGLICAFRDINAQAPNHILIVPREHKESLSDFSNDGEDAELLGNILLAVPEVAKREGLESYRIVINTGVDAGQTVFHFHAHVLGGRTFGWPPG